MKTDIDLKKLFSRVLDDVLLEVVGDKGATLDEQPVTHETQQTRRTPDLLAKLHSKEGVAYYRMFEFNSYDEESSLLERCALYVLMLRAQLDAPVLATIIQVRPPALAGRLTLGGPPKPELCRWQFDVVNLWDLPAQMAFERHSAGLLALVPLMKGSTPELAEQALRALLALDESEQVADARVALLNLAEEKYPGLELIRLVSREQIMSSSLFEKFRKEIWDEAAAQGVAEGMTRGIADGMARGIADGMARGIADGMARGIADGMAKGRLGAERELCLERVARDYPDLLDAARPVIEACSDTDKLKDWILTSGAVDAASFARRLGVKD